MPTRGRPSGEALVDTSVAITLVVASHDHHTRTVEAVSGHRLGLAGHAWFETYSVLTRLPGDIRRAPREVADLLAHNFPATKYLDARSADRLRAELAEAAVAGGSVYDALVGAAARAHGLPLFTRDRRALGVYSSLGVEVKLVDT